MVQKKCNSCEITLSITRTRTQPIYIYIYIYVGKLLKGYTHFTEYKLAAILSAALSRVHVLPPLVVLSKIPLPPAAQASSCTAKS